MNIGQIDPSTSSDAPGEPASAAGKGAGARFAGFVQEKLAGGVGRILQVKNAPSDTASAAGAKGHMIGSGLSRSEHNANYMLYAITAFFAVTLTWASFAELDQVTRGTGKVIPSKEMQLVQNLEGGIIKKILVRKGQVVKAGEPLFILDKTALKSKFDQGRQQQMALTAKIVRLMAQIKQTKLVFPPDVIKGAPRVIATETLLYTGREAEMKSQIRFLKGQIKQRKQEL